MERGSGRKCSYLVGAVCESERNEIHQCGHSGRAQWPGKVGRHVGQVERKMVQDSASVPLCVWCVCVCMILKVTTTQKLNISHCW